jgi:hypothetical protein
MANRFVEIMNDAISEAERIDCPVAEFRLGLAEMWHVIQERCEVEDIDPRRLAREGQLDDDG